MVDDALEIHHVRFLQDGLDSKQSLQGDVPRTGVSLRQGGNLSKVYGHAGIAVESTVDMADLANPTNFQLRISGEQLQPLITEQAPLPQNLVEGLVDALSAASAALS